MYKRLKLSARIIAKCQKRGEFVSDVKLVNSAKWWSKFPNLIVWPTEKIDPFFPKKNAMLKSRFVTNRNTFKLYRTVFNFQMSLVKLNANNGTIKHNLHYTDLITSQMVDKSLYHEHMKILSETKQENLKGYTCMPWNCQEVFSPLKNIIVTES